MKLLALETSGKRLGACLWEDYRVRGFKIDKDGESYSNRLMPLLDGLFKKTRWNISDVEAVAVDVGPGRFTGVRIGVSVGRTLGQVLQKPVIEVNSLEAVAAQSSGWEIGKSFMWKFSQNLLCVLTDARHGDLYMAVWRFHKLTGRSRRGPPSGKSYHTFGHHFKLVHAPTLFPFDRFLAFFQSCFQEQTLFFAGSAIPLYRQQLQKAFGKKARFAKSIEEVDPRYVAALGYEKFFRRDVKSYNEIFPLYMRPSYAEEKKGTVPFFK